MNGLKWKNELLNLFGMKKYLTIKMSKSTKDISCCIILNHFNFILILAIWRIEAARKWFLDPQIQIKSLPRKSRNLLPHNSQHPLVVKPLFWFTVAVFLLLAQLFFSKITKILNPTFDPFPDWFLPGIRIPCRL